MADYRCRECHYVTWNPRRPPAHCPACASGEVRKITSDYWRAELYRHRWDQVLKNLPKSQMYSGRIVIKLLYGLNDDDGYCYTLAQVAKMFKRSAREIRQIETEAIRKLRQPARVRKAKELGLLSKYSQLTVPRGMARLARRVAKEL